MATKALLIDFKVLAPISIDYSKASNLIRNRSKGKQFAQPKDIFEEIDIVKESARKEEFQQLAAEIDQILDELETSQISAFSLNMGVKSGLEALDSLDVSVFGVTNLGEKAAAKFLKERGIDGLLTGFASRDKIGEPVDIVALLNYATEKHKVKSGEAVYFCNKLADLKAAKSTGIRIIVLPSKGERLDLLMLEKPLGMIMSLEEIPNLLSLEIARTKQAEQQQQLIQQPPRPESESEADKPVSEKKTDDGDDDVSREN